MAENAANFTKTFQIKPSVLEIIAQKSLNDTLYPAFERTCLFLASNFPQKFGWLNSFYDEAFLMLNGVLEFYYLKHYDASFSENFYSLKRILGNGGNLKEYNKNISLIFIVVLPYLRRKLNEKYYIIRLENAEGLLQKTIIGYSKLLLLYSHTAIEILWNLWNINHFITYMANRTDFQTPSLKLQDIKLTYGIESPEKLNVWQSFSKGEIGFSGLFIDVVRNSIVTSLEVGAFFLQFMNSWNIKKLNYDMRDLPNVSAPTSDNKSRNLQGKCPVCYKFWVIPSVLQVSGYIFCFRCILKYLNEHQRCPVTKLPAKPLDIVRLYTS